MAGLTATAVAGFAVNPADLLLIQRGPVALKPQFVVSETFSDNVTYDDTNQKADLITTISPGLRLQLGAKEYNFIGLSYFFERLQYADNTELSANQHRIDLASRYEKRRFLLQGHDQIQFLSSPLGGGISIGGRRIDRNMYVDEYRLSYSLSERTGTYIEGQHSMVDYQDDQPLYDSRTLTGTLGFQYLAFSQSFAFGEFYFGQTDNERNLPAMFEYPTATFFGGFLGLRGNFTERLTGTVKAGYETRDYADDRGGIAVPVVDFLLTQRFTENSIVTFSYSRRQGESVQYVRSPFTIDSINVDYLQNIGNDGRLRANVRGSYILSAYEENPAYVSGRRDDTQILGGLTITYDIKLWLRAFGGYQLEYLESTEPTVREYTVNRVSVGLELGY